jgi:type I restriction-modification system DNA methylase subunit
MNAEQLSLVPVIKHYNQQLFSDYYLDRQLAERSEWYTLAGEAQRMMERIAAIRAAFTPTSKEAQTRHAFIHPVLDALGYIYEVEAALATPYGVKQMDCLLYRDQQALNANKGKTLDDEILLRGGGLAVLEAKHWGRNLDETIKSHKDPTSSNPAAQITFYMQHSNMPWGILTNGQRWRLYHRDTAYKLDRFYEVDLEELLQANDPQLFLYFYVFFRRQAFDDQPLSLANLLRESNDYARGIGDTLKEQAYLALRHLAQGFLDYPKNHLSTNDADLQHIYDNSLIVLYRLLFILYAESRQLLPIRESKLYRKHYSLYSITEYVRTTISDGCHLLADTGLLWCRLRELFHLIDVGNPPLKLATYDGGLFDPQHHIFLEQHTIGDYHLQWALYHLAFMQNERIDYSKLAVRHLGSIYEGLLENQLHATTSEAGWSIDLYNDQGKRKTSGSYYTPDYIVRYIVEQALAPVVQQALATAHDDTAKVRAILALKVLDPSMGSGHFLVEATEYIARLLVEHALPADTKLPTNGKPDMAYWKRRVVQSCIYGVDVNPLAVELAKLSLWLATIAKNLPLSFLDHHLRTGNTLVGTYIRDIHAGGLATATRSRIQDEPATEQQTMFDDQEFQRSISTAVDSMWLIERHAGNTVADVREQEATYALLRDRLIGKYGRLADLIVASYLGLAIDPNLWQSLVAFEIAQATPQTVELETLLTEWLDTAHEMTRQQRFFHWEMEFPEVFFDAHGNPLNEQAGFDVVVGNPPYVRQEALGISKQFFAARYTSYHSKADLYTYFFEQGLALLKDRGEFGFIVSNKFLRANYGTPLRNLLLEQTRLRQIVDFGELPVFAEAATFPAIVLLQKGNPAAQQQVAVARIKRLDVSSLEHDVNEQQYVVNEQSLAADGWSLAKQSAMQLLHTITQGHIPLGDYTRHQILSGVKTGLNEAFWIDQQTYEQLINADSASQQLIRPMVIGDDVRRYRIEQKNRFMIVIPSGWSSEQCGLPPREQDANKANREQKAWQWFARSYPALANHLLPFEAAARKRWDRGEFWWELRPCDYYHLFEQPKIVYPDIALESRFTIDTQGFYAANTVYTLPMEDYYLLALLNSRLIFTYMQQKTTVLGDAEARGRLRFIAQYMEHLPVRRIAFTTPLHLREQLLHNALTLLHADRYDDLLALVRKCLEIRRAPVRRFKQPLRPRTLAQLPHGLRRSVKRGNVPSAALWRKRWQPYHKQSACSLIRSLVRHTQRVVKPEQSDVVHDVLAHLAQQMIALASQQQTALEDLLLDLEGVLSASDMQRIQRLWTPPVPPKDNGNNMQQRQATYRAKQAEAQQHLGDLANRTLTLRKDVAHLSEAQWRWVLKQRLKKTPHMADLVRLYRRHHPTIAACEQRLRRQDDVIDRMVAILYGVEDLVMAGENH